MEEALKAKHGIIAMIDALGVRNATIEESSTFIKSIQSILKRTPNFMNAFYAGEGEKLKKYTSDPPQLTTFGDTFIFSWEMNLDELPKFLPDVGVFLSYVVKLGFEYKLAFRGAISFGDYIQSGATVLGPAISDVASWYDSAEMIGVFATPFCGHFLSRIHQKHEITKMEFVQYEVPLKGNISKKLWTVAWPNIIVTAKTPEKSDLECYYNFIEKFPIPKGTEDKYFNTEKYVKSVLGKK
jgi:hypothetical protein